MVGPREFRRSGYWPSLLYAFLYFETSFMLWTLIGELGVFIAQAFHLSAGQKGLIVAIPLVSGSILRIVLGVAADRFGPRKVGITAIDSPVAMRPQSWHPPPPA